jgi:hypothetical protein
MTTKNKSVFAPKYILVSRKDYDEALCCKENQMFLQHLFATYKRTWCLGGVKFYNLDAKDFVKMFKLLV